MLVIITQADVDACVSEGPQDVCPLARALLALGVDLTIEDDGDGQDPS